MTGLEVQRAAEAHTIAAAILALPSGVFDMADWAIHTLSVRAVTEQCLHTNAFNRNQVK